MRAVSLGDSYAENGGLILIASEIGVPPYPLAQTLPHNISYTYVLHNVSTKQ